MKLKYVILLCSTFLFTSSYMLAQEHNRPPSLKPPPEAIKACEGKVEGDVVSFETRRGDTLEGSCKKIDAQLVAVPDNVPPPPCIKKTEG
jgi:hypothetical protein